MEVNNAMYETMGEMWWSDQAGFEFTSLRYCVNPLRYAYFKTQLARINPPGDRVLDVGCGGGFLAEEFANDGYEVTGIDPAVNSIAAAREHAASKHLRIAYQVGCGEDLPFSDGSFDIVACCDVLEHVSDVEKVIHEASRVLCTGGVFLYDTVNRTFRSWIGLIKVWQDWNLVGFNCPNAHVWNKFIKPKELIEMMRAAKLVPGDVTGMAPVKHPLALIRTLRQIRTGEIHGDALRQEFEMRVTADLSTSYMGWAVK